MRHAARNRPLSVAGLLLSIVVLTGLVGCTGPLGLNFAAAFGWRGLVDTDVQFGEFFGSDHTVAARFMLQYPAAYAGPIIASDSDGPGSFFVGMGNLVVAEGEVGSDQLRLQLHVDGQNRYYTLGGLLAPERWYHLAVVRSGNTFRLYLNGAKLDSDGCTTAPLCDLVLAASGPSGSVRLGRLADGSSLVGHEAQFYGLIDDVAIFDTALTGAAIAALRDNPRLTGIEAGLLAGFTFDSSAPSGGALPSTLGRSATFHSPADQGVTYEGVGALLPAQKVPISRDRDDAFDAGFLPPPFQRIETRLPFPPGEAWDVIQGWETPGGSHKGRASFTWDFILAGQPQSASQGRPIVAAAGGTVSEIEGAESCGDNTRPNYIMVDHAPNEIGAYLHFLAGSLQVGVNDPVDLPDYLADTGDTGVGCGAHHLHYGLHNLPESQAGTLVTFPSAFSFYEASDDDGASWYPVTRGIPQVGQWVRNAAGGNSPPQITITAPANLSGFPYGGLNEVLFEATATDAEDGANCCTIRWSSYTDGQIGTGAQLGHVFASPGERVVSATATDSGGAIAKATIIVDITNTAPTATIVTPTPGQNLFRDIPYVFHAQANDVNEPVGDLCSGAEWTSTVATDPVLSGCAPEATFTTEGPRTLTFTTTDSYGLDASTDVAITVVAQPTVGPPLVTITQPTADTLLFADNVYALQGSATDPDGKIPLAFRWSVVDYFGTEHTIATGDYFPGVPGFDISAIWTPSDDIPFNCGGGTVDLHLEVTDPDGETGRDEIEIYVFYPVC